MENTPLKMFTNARKSRHEKKQFDDPTYDSKKRINGSSSNIQSTLSIAKNIGNDDVKNSDAFNNIMKGVLDLSKRIDEKYVPGKSQKLVQAASKPGTEKDKWKVGFGKIQEQKHEDDNHRQSKLEIGVGTSSKYLSVNEPANQFYYTPTMAYRDMSEPQNSRLIFNSINSRVIVPQISNTYPQCVQVRPTSMPRQRSNINQYFEGPVICSRVIGNQPASPASPGRIMSAQPIIRRGKTENLVRNLSPHQMIEPIHQIQNRPIIYSEQPQTYQVRPIQHMPNVYHHHLLEPQNPQLVRHVQPMPQGHQFHPNLQPIGSHPHPHIYSHPHPQYLPHHQPHVQLQPHDHIQFKVQSHPQHQVNPESKNKIQQQIVQFPNLAQNAQIFSTKLVSQQHQLTAVGASPKDTNKPAPPVRLPGMSQQQYSKLLLQHSQMLKLMQQLKQDKNKQQTNIQLLQQSIKNNQNIQKSKKNVKNVTRIVQKNIINQQNIVNTEYIKNVENVRNQFYALNMYNTQNIQHMENVQTMLSIGTFSTSQLKQDMQGVKNLQKLKILYQANPKQFLSNPQLLSQLENCLNSTTSGNRPLKSIIQASIQNALALSIQHKTASQKKISSNHISEEGREPMKAIQNLMSQNLVRKTLFNSLIESQKKRLENLEEDAKIKEYFNDLNELKSNSSNQGKLCLKKMDELLEKYGKKPVQFKDPLAPPLVDNLSDTIINGLSNFANMLFSQPKSQQVPRKLIFSNENDIQPLTHSDKKVNQAQNSADNWMKKHFK